MSGTRRPSFGLIAGVAMLITGCSTSPSASALATGPAGSGATTINVLLTNSGCAPDPASVTAGSVTINVSNQGGTSVDEVELMLNDKIVAEREDLAPGLSGTFTAQLQPGSYVLSCPGATTPQANLEVVASPYGQ